MTEACAICFTPPPLPEAAKPDSCPHAFCFACISRWAGTETRCPLCREAFTSIHRLGGGEPAPVTQRRQVYVWDGTLEAADAELLGIVCRHCRRGDDEANLMLCERFEVCGMAAHARCLHLPGVPEDEWLCQRCRPRPVRPPRGAALRRLPRPERLPSRVSGAQEAGSLPAEEVTEDVLDGFGRPPSPDDASRAQERRWVSRQRAIAASVDAQRAVDARSAPDPAARRARHTGLRTVRELRANWAELRTGVLTFAGLVPPSPPSRRAPSRMALVPVKDCAGDAAERAWAAFDAVRSAPAEAPRRPAPQPAASLGGHLEHIAWAKRRRLERAAGLAPPPQLRSDAPLPLPDMEQGEAELLASILDGGGVERAPQRPSIRIPKKAGS